MELSIRRLLIHRPPAQAGTYLFPRAPPRALGRVRPALPHPAAPAPLCPVLRPPVRVSRCLRNRAHLTSTANVPRARLPVKRRRPACLSLLLRRRRFRLAGLLRCQATSSLRGPVALLHRRLLLRRRQAPFPVLPFRRVPLRRVPFRVLHPAHPLLPVPQADDS